MIEILGSLFNLFGKTKWLDKFIFLFSNVDFIKKIISIALSLTGASSFEDAVKTFEIDEDKKNQFKKEIIKLEKLYYSEMFKDRQNARDRDLAVRQMRGGNLRSNIMFLISLFGIVISLFVLIFFHSKLSSDLLGIFSAIISIFGACLKDVYSFEFGSSSRQKYSNDYSEEENLFSIDKYGNLT